MKTSLKIIVLFIALLCFSQAEAQFLKKLQNKIENKLERRLEKKADQKADQALDSVFTEKTSKKKSRKNANQDKEISDSKSMDFGGMMEAAMNRKPVEINNSYTFNLTTTMEITTSGNKPMTMKTSYGDGVHYIEMGNGMNIISDYKNEAMITLDEDKKTAQAISLGLMKMFENSDVQLDETDAGDITVRKTGKTKTINGYRCEQYIINGSDFNTEGWFTKDVNFDMVAHASSMSEFFKDAPGQAMMNSNVGFPMEMVTTAGKDTVTMKILELTEKTQTIALSGYKVSQL